jgi:putative heme-binding domain-containing protein
MRLFAVFCLSAIFPLAAQHEQEAKEKSKHPFIGDIRAIEAGRKLFVSGCAACHGPEGQGGRGPNLREKVFWHNSDDEALYSAIKKGIPDGGMPPANLPDDQVWQLVAFVRSLTSPAFETFAPGNPKSGESLFWGKAECGGCHRIRGRGSLLGPDLSDIGATRALAQLRQAVLDPDADGAPGYRSVRVTLKSGTTLDGVARNRTNYSLQLQDAKGNLHSILMRDVVEISLSKGSPMPKDFGKRLSRDELDDVLAYLSRQSVRASEITKK